MKHIYTCISIILLLAVISPSLSAQDIPPTAPTEATPPPPPPPLHIVDEKKVYKVVDEMPRFPGCEYKDYTKQAKKRCADGELLKYIYKNLVYPKDAKKDGIQGTAVITFIIEADGSITNVEIKRDPGKGTGEAARQVVMDMNNLPERWTPGKQNGKPTSVKYTLPVKFKL